MARTFQMQGRVEISADRLLKLLTDRNEVDIYARSTGVDRVSVTETGRNSERVQLEIYREEPSWHGGDPKKATFTQTWDLAHRCCRWERRDHERPGHIFVRGIIRIETVDNNVCLLKEEGEVDIRIPLFGSRIEKKIARDLEAKQGRDIAYWERRANEDGEI